VDFSWELIDQVGCVAFHGDTTLRQYEYAVSGWKQVRMK